MGHLTDPLRRLRDDARHLARSTVLRRKGDIEAYWWRDVVNFGDLLTPALLRSFGLRPFHRRLERAPLLGIGSLLQVVPDGFRGTIFGSGFLREGPPRRLAAATVLAVRGALTRDLLGLPASTPLGDPGLLAPRLLEARPAPTHRVGLVAHYVDKEHPVVRGLVARLGADLLVIDVQREPVPVVEDVARCACVVTSSLHGRVVADALGIPSRWLSLSAVIDPFKFFDYDSAFEVRRAPWTPSGSERAAEIEDGCDPVPPGIRERVAALEALVPLLPAVR